MAWDFETDPDFQTELDWMDEFVRDEVEPLDFVLDDPYDKCDERAMEILRPLQAAGEGRAGCGRAISVPSSAARATAR